jgi:hypothetical protein
MEWLAHRDRGTRPAAKTILSRSNIATATQSRWMAGALASSAVSPAAHTIFYNKAD